MTKGCQLKQNGNKSSCGNINILQLLGGVKLLKVLTLRCEFPDVAVIRLSEKDIEKTSKSEFGISEDDNGNMLIHV